MEVAMQNLDLINIDKASWQTFRFEEIAEKISKTVKPEEADVDIYVGLEHLDAEDIHIKRKGVPSDVKGGKLRCYPGDIIFGKRRAYQRKAAIVDFEGICSAHAFVFRANPDVIEPELFPFFLHSDQFMHRMVDISVGGLSPTINWGDLKGQEFLLPPKDQQKQLAELLWAMDDVIEKEREVLERLDTNYQVWFKNFFNNNIKLDHDGLKKGWVIKKAKEICTLIKDGTHGSYKDSENGIPLLSAKDIKDGLIKKEDNPRLISISDFKSIHKNYQLQNDDLLVTIVGTVGNIAIIKNYNNQYTFQRSVGILRLNEFLDKNFIYYYMQSVFFQQELKRKTVTSIQSGVYLEELGNCRFIIPDNESINIVNDNSKKHMQAKSDLESKIISSQALQKSLINQIF
jgi:type I restriction enzyme S subunit